MLQKCKLRSDSKHMLISIFSSSWPIEMHCTSFWRYIHNKQLISLNWSNQSKNIVTKPKNRGAVFFFTPCMVGVRHIEGRGRARAPPIFATFKGKSLLWPHHSLGNTRAHYNWAPPISKTQLHPWMGLSHHDLNVKMDHLVSHFKTIFYVKFYFLDN